MIFCGDYFQIPPVATDPVYFPFQSSGGKTFNVSQCQKDASSLEDRCYQICRDIKHDIILEESVRHKDGLIFEKCINNIRFGLFTKEYISLLNSCFVDHSTSTELFNIKLSRFPIVLNTNDIRT